MDKPVCRLCGSRHWSNEPHDFHADSGQKPEKGRKPPESEGASKEALRKRKWRDKNRKAYNAYMKEYMRKRRL
jgi:hypothetical protein